MVMKELIRCDEETQKTFLKEVSNLQQEALLFLTDKTEYLAPHQPVIYYTQMKASHMLQQILLCTFLFWGF